MVPAQKQIRLYQNMYLRQQRTAFWQRREDAAPNSPLPRARIEVKLSDGISFVFPGLCNQKGAQAFFVGSCYLFSRVRKNKEILHLKKALTPRAMLFSIINSVNAILRYAPRTEDKRHRANSALFDFDPCSKGRELESGVIMPLPKCYGNFFLHSDDLACFA